MRPFHLVVNWKAHKTFSEASRWVQVVGSVLTYPDRVTVCPSFPFIIPLVQLCQQHSWPLGIGAQTISGFGEGPYTGEVAAPGLAGWAELVLVGHSERRRYLREDDEYVLKQLKTLTASSLTPLLLTTEVEEVVGFTHHLPAGAIIAFERPDAISTTLAAGKSLQHFIQEATAFAKVVRQRVSHPISVYYGGSVNPTTITAILAQKVFDGAVIGQAGLASESFLEILHAVRAAT